MAETTKSGAGVGAASIDNDSPPTRICIDAAMDRAGRSGGAEVPFQEHNESSSLRWHNVQRPALVLGKSAAAAALGRDCTQDCSSRHTVEKFDDGNVVEDVENAAVSTGSDGRDGGSKGHRFCISRAGRRVLCHLAVWLVFTGYVQYLNVKLLDRSGSVGSDSYYASWWVAGLILHRSAGWVVPFLLWLAITLRLFFLHIPASVVGKPMRAVWDSAGLHANNAIPPPWRIPLLTIVTAAAFLAGAFASNESADNTRENRAVSLFGLVVIIAVLWATSRDRRRIRWRTVVGGMLAQIVIAVFVLRTRLGYDIFSFISTLARSLLGFAGQGTTFLTAPSVARLNWFLTGVMPPVIFFVALVQTLYHLGVLQWFVIKLAAFFFWLLEVSGPEAVVAAASPFVGQGESAMLVRPFINHLTLAEIHQIMTSGFATIAGSVLIVYIGLGLNPQALLSSCIMSIPASLAVSKLRFPETEETLAGARVVIPDDDDRHRPANALHAFANGAWLGLKIAGMIVATLLCIIALLGLINGLLSW